MEKTLEKNTHTDAWMHVLPLKYLRTGSSSIEHKAVFCVIPKRALHSWNKTITTFGCSTGPVCCDLQPDKTFPDVLALWFKIDGHIVYEFTRKSYKS